MNRLALVFLVLTLAVGVMNTAYAEGKITVDPNGPGKIAASEAAKDSRLEQKVSYEVKSRAIADLTEDLADLAGITFFAGRSKSDWRVREDCCTVIAKSIPLADLMRSIAHTMKMRWVRGGKSPNWTYRLVEDSAAIAEVKRRVARQQERDAAKRRECWEKIQRISRMTEQELEQVREEDPMLYIQAKEGLLGLMVDLFAQVPTLKDAWLAGQEFQLSTAWLPKGAQETAIRACRASLGLGSRIGVEQRYIARQTAKLDENRQPTNIWVSKSGPRSPLPDCFVGSIFAFSFGSAGDVTGYRQIRYKAMLKAYEEKRPMSEVYKEMEMRGQLKPAPQTWRFYLSSYTQEAFTDHPDDPELSQPLKQKVQAKKFTDLIASLADATGFAIVTDDLMDDVRGENTPTFDQGTKLREALDKFSMATCYYNWSKRGRIIELWNSNWYDVRNSRVSKAWLEALRRRFRETGTLDIDDLADIAALTDEQMQGNICYDQVLTPAVSLVFNKRSYLRIYASLTPTQRSMLLSGGLTYSQLTPEQQQSVIKLISGQSVPLLQDLNLGAIGATISCTRNADGKRFVYTLKAATRLGELPWSYTFKTPLYVEPRKPAAPPVDR